MAPQHGSYYCKNTSQIKVSVKAILSTDLVDKTGDNIFDSDKLSEEVKAQSKKSHIVEKSRKV